MGNNSSWRDNITFMSPTFEEHDVNGETQKFYPVSYKKLMQLKRIGRPLVLAITSLFQGKNSDAGTTIRDFPAERADGFGGRETVCDAITVDVLQYREREREMAIDKLIDALTEDSNIMTVGEIIMDSMRDVFPRKPSKDDVSCFMFGEDDHPGLDPGTIWQLCEGVIKANRRSFDPLLARLRAFTGDLGARAKEVLQQTLEDRLASRTLQGPDEETTEDEATKTESQTDGKTSSSPTPTTDIGETSKTP